MNENSVWQPISTAPRDGIWILICREGDDCSYAGFWQDAIEDGVDYMGEDGGFVEVDFQRFYPSRSFGKMGSRYKGSQPTLWQPLPSPPTREEPK